MGWVCRGVGEAGGDDVSLDRRVGGGRGGGLREVGEGGVLLRNRGEQITRYLFVYLFIYLYRGRYITGFLF